MDSDLRYVHETVQVSTRPFRVNDVFDSEDGIPVVRAPGISGEVWELLTSYSPGLLDPITEMAFPHIQSLHQQARVYMDAELRLHMKFTSLLHERRKREKTLAAGVDRGREGASLDGMSKELDSIYRDWKLAVFKTEGMLKSVETASSDRLGQLRALVRIVNTQMPRHFNDWWPSQELLEDVADEIAFLKRPVEPSEWHRLHTSVAAQTGMPLFAPGEVDMTGRVGLPDDDIQDYGPVEGGTLYDRVELAQIIADLRVSVR